MLIGPERKYTSMEVDLSLCLVLFLYELLQESFLILVSGILYIFELIKESWKRRFFSHGALSCTSCITVVNTHLGTPAFLY